MPIMQQTMSTNTGTIRSITRPRSFLVSASVASSMAPRSGLPASVFSSCRFIGPKSNLEAAKRNMATMVSMA